MTNLKPPTCSEHIYVCSGRVESICLPAHHAACSRRPVPLPLSYWNPTNFCPYFRRVLSIYNTVRVLSIYNSLWAAHVIVPRACRWCVFLLALAFQPWGGRDVDEERVRFSTVGHEHVL